MKSCCIIYIKETTPDRQKSKHKSNQENNYVITKNNKEITVVITYSTMYGEILKL